MKPLNRIGDKCKCPACGWALDDGAYRCPKCLIYFCFKCRRRVKANEPQTQCLNQQCDYHGKLLCSACTVMVVTQAEGSHGYTYSVWASWPYGCAIIAFFGAWLQRALPFFFDGFIGFIGAFVALFALACGICRLWLKWPLVTVMHVPPGETVDVESRACISCKQAVEVLVD